MRLMEILMEIFILVAIAVVFMVIRQLLDLDGIVIGLTLIVYLQYRELHKIKRELNKRNQ